MRNVERDYPDYLRDESRRPGKADSISFPKMEDEIKSHLAHARDSELTVTVQGARTGITAGAVPDGGHIINLSRMNAILNLRHDSDSEEFFLTVQPGVLLSEIQESMERHEFNWGKDLASDRVSGSERALEEMRANGSYFFPPDPTEASASIGGMVSCNSSGARSFHYGATRKYVERLRVVLAGGSVVLLARGDPKADGRCFSVVTNSGRKITGDLPSYDMPQVKNAAGYYSRPDMDLLDLFIGSEGTLGIVTEIELRLIRAPGALWGVTAFLPSEASALDFVEKVRCTEAGPAAIEFFDHHALNLLREQKKTNPAFKEIPDIPQSWHTAVYVEYHGSDDESVEQAVMQMSKTMIECGGGEEATWLASDEREMQRLKDFRHAVPEAVNLLIDQRMKKEPGLTKLGTDLAVPDAALREVMTLYHSGLDNAGLEFVMFGHIGSNHVHVNIVPRNLAEYERGKDLYGRWGQAVVDLGGTVSAEHGIGKLKKTLLGQMYGKEGIRQMKTVKEQFDPECLLNRGNLF